MEEKKIVDLRSDTVTQPSAAMRAAMAAAPVGDDVFGEDPSVNELQRRAAVLTGKEAALFVPSGTMANLLAFLSQTRPGDSAILSAESHPFNFENANIAMVGGLLARPIADPLGKMTAEQVRAQIVQKDDPHYSCTTLVAIENTTNRGGGACYTVEEVETLGRMCRERGLKLHCDGARIFNAALACGAEVSGYAQWCGTLSFCLSKGLGAPVGSLLTGSAETIHRARRFRKMLGGGMRQAGILAAAGLYALDHHIEDLREDHRRVREFRAALERLGAVFPLPSPTNIVYIESERDAESLRDRLAAHGVRVMATEPRRIRAVFHRDVDDAGLDAAIAAFRAVW